MKHKVIYVTKQAGGDYFYSYSREKLSKWVRGGKVFAIKYSPIRKATCIY